MTGSYDRTARMQVVQGDITRVEVDAIVNAANPTLLGGGGVDGAIHRAAGPRLLEECRALGGCEPGEAKVTRGYDLPAHWVIHTMGPVWRGGSADEEATLRRCYRSVFARAAEVGARSVAFPSISTGVYGYPLERAVPTAVAQVHDLLREAEIPQQVLFVCFDAPTLDAYRRAVES